MKILKTIKGAVQNIVVFEDNGIKTTVARPAIIPVEVIVDEIKEICDKKPKVFDLDAKPKRKYTRHYDHDD